MEHPPQSYKELKQKNYSIACRWADALKTGRFACAMTEGIGCCVMSAAAVWETEGAGHVYPVTGSIPASYGSCGGVSRRYWNAVKGF